MFDLPRFFVFFFNRHYAPIYVPTVIALILTLSFSFGERSFVVWVLGDRWSVQYFLLAPFMHSGAAHFLLNVVALHYIGGMMLLPILGKRRFVGVFILGLLAGNLLNNLMTDSPAIGLSAAVMGVLSCALYPFGRAPMKFVVLHDVLRLPPFPLYGVAVFVVMLDVCAIIFDRHFFAHWAHLGGFAAGLVFGYVVFRLRRNRRS